MHANIQWRINPDTGEEAPYLRFRESYRDVRGKVHSLVILNVGFEPRLHGYQMHRIARALTDRFANRHQLNLFGSQLQGLTDEEHAFVEH